MDKIKILFLCTGNSCRSQMAEGLVNSVYGAKFHACSAGVKPEKEISQLAVEVMGEIGINISNNKPKNLSQFKDDSFEYVVTLCSNAQENCPYFPAKTKVIHKGFQDPMPTNDIKIYRNVRDEIKSFIRELCNS
jgi:arsenate reductase (thioredoxin)